MQNRVVEIWCNERIQLIAGLLETLELKESQIPANAEELGEHQRRVAIARAEAASYVLRLQTNQSAEYHAYPHNPSALQVGLLLVPSLPGYWSLPWKSEQLPTVLHLLAIEAEAISTICRAKNSIAESSWLLNQVRSELKKLDEQSK